MIGIWGNPFTVARGHWENQSPFLGFLVLLIKEVKNRLEQKPRANSLEFRSKALMAGKANPSSCPEEENGKRGKAWRSDTGQTAAT